MALKEHSGFSRVHRREGKYKCPKFMSRKANLWIAPSSVSREAAPKAGIVAEVRRRECYESPSVKRRKKREAARKNRNKRNY